MKTAKPKDDFNPMVWVNRYCRVITQQQCAKKGLTPLLVLGDMAIVPNWDEYNRGGTGWAAKQIQIKDAAYSKLCEIVTGHSPSKIKKTAHGQPSAMRQGTIFDVLQYTDKHHG